MYKTNSLWDQEQEKQERYDNSTANGDGPDYHENKDYASNEQSDIYSSDKADEEKKKEKTGIEKEVAKEDKKYEKKENASDEDIKKSAASEVHDSTKNQDDDKKKKVHKSIEDAINKAMKEEKELIYMDD